MDTIAASELIPVEEEQQDENGVLASLTGQQRAMITALRHSGTVSAAARLQNMYPRQHYRWLEASEDYRREAELAQREFFDAVEEELIRRAIEGVEEPVFGKLHGKDTGEGIIGHINKKSDFLLSKLIQAKKPEQYRDRKDTVNVNVQGQIDTTVTHKIVPDDILALVTSGAVKGDRLAILRAYMTERQQKIVNGTFSEEEDGKSRARMLEQVMPQSTPMKMIEPITGDVP